MADPAIIVCPEDTWTKVATAVKTGQIWINDVEPKWFQTYRATGNPAPLNKDDAVRLRERNIAISSTEDIDVYLYSEGNAGEIRIDL